MPFTKACRISAILVVAYAVLHLALALLHPIAASGDGEFSQQLARFRPTQIFLRGVYTLLIGIALGTLSDISRALQSKNG